MKRNVAILCLIIATISCNNNEFKKGLLPFDTMQVVMQDFFVAEEWHNSVISRDSIARKMKNNYEMYQQVLDIHKISKGKFDSSFKYYEEHHDLLKKLIDTLNTFNTSIKEKLLLKMKK